MRDEPALEDDLAGRVEFRAVRVHPRCGRPADG